MAPSVDEIKLEEIDFDKVKQCKDKHVLKRYIKLLTDDGAYFKELLQACKDRLLEVAPKEYYLLYPKVASDQEIDDARRDLLDWEASVQETDQALKAAQKDRIFDESKVRAPIRGMEQAMPRANVQRDPDANRRKEVLNRPDDGKNDQYARDKTSMRDYYRTWDKVNIDELEQELDEEEQKAEDARRKHFEDLKGEQAKAHAFTPIEVGGALPEGVPEAHRKHLADSEKEKGNEAFYSKDWEEAEAYYSRSIHYRADDPSTWANRALVRLKLERAEEALEDCDRSLALNARYMKALHRKGKALHELRRYEEAVKYFQLALAESPGNTQINGDLMVARRKLRSSGTEPPREEPKMFSPPPRRVDSEPTCTIEEVEDEAPGSGAGYTRVVIEEASDSEDEEAEEKQASALSAAPAAGAASGFRKVPIAEDSDSEEEKAAAAPPAAGFKKVAIVEESDSEDEEPAANGAAAAASEAAGSQGGQAVSFDDMD